MTNLAIALLGQKFMGRAHSNAWGQVNKFFDLPLKAALDVVVGRDVSELAAFAKRWGWQRFAADWRAVVRDDAVGLVDIVTPNDLHAEPALAALEAGKHVACEKPLAGTLDQARAMRDAAKKHAKKAKTFVWFNYRRCPAVALAQRLIASGKLGRIYHVRAHYLQEWGGPDTPLLWRFQKKIAGSGAHGDLNAHIVDMARFLLGDEVVEVHGAVSRTFITERVIPGSTKTGKSDVDDAVLFLASFKGGAVASFEASRVAFGHQNDNSIEVNGEKGSLRFSFEDMNVLWHADATAPRATSGWTRIMATEGAHHPYVKAWWPSAHVLGYEHGFVNMAADILRVLAGQEPEAPLPDFDDAYQTQRVLEAALLSAKERTAIKLAQVK
ncbi:MAG: Gfo/Idh/MocA family oxidoreductase [Planctomycetes bacterium]|nr:Gfo/Idh/MocA family oxidoreductase [Planctomycetota bacterium]MCC7170653.1 Gfo/Idh/MocA family oxidoreductase [Planctomycetota bacterium]